jgi:hypothetical protein
METTRLGVVGKGTCEWCGRTLIKGVWERQREQIWTPASQGVTVCPDCVLQVRLETTVW